MIKQWMAVDRPDEDAVIVAMLARLGSDQAALERFLDTTGLDIRALRAALTDRSLSDGLLHYLVTNEDLLVHVAGELGAKPEVIADLAFGHRTAQTAEKSLLDVTAGKATRASALARRVRPKA